MEPHNVNYTDQRGVVAHLSVIPRDFLITGHLDRWVREESKPQAYGQQVFCIVSIELSLWEISPLCVCVCVCVCVHACVCARAHMHVLCESSVLAGFFWAQAVFPII